MAAISSVIAGIAAGIAAAGTSYAIVSGEQGKKAQEKAMQQQQRAQQAAAQQAESQAVKSEAAMRRAGQQTPDVAGIMAAAQEGAAGGPSATMLTGPQGIDPSQLSLGRNTLLGS
jgi:hypothetical protein